MKRIKQRLGFLLFCCTAVAHPLVAQSPPPLVLRFGGDCLLAGHYEEAAATDPAMALRDFDLLRTADISMVNLECPVTLRGMKVEKPYSFRMKPSYLAALTEGGVDVVNLANNHVFDFGPEGLFDTISYLDSAGVRHVGAGRNAEEAYRPVVVRLKGHTVGFVGYYGGGESPAATQEEPGVARREVQLVSRDIARLRERDSADFVVVNLHWGEEKADTPDVSYIRFAHKVIDAGADLIVGHHPHVLQGIERYKEGVIAYSLGNLIFGGNSRHTYDTAILEVRLSNDSVAYELIPVGVRRWRAKTIEGREAQVVIDRARSLSGVFPRTISQLQEHE